MSELDDFFNKIIEQLGLTESFIKAKERRKEYSKEYYLKNKEKIKEHKKEYYLRNKTK